MQCLNNKMDYFGVTSLETQEAWLKRRSSSTASVVDVRNAFPAAAAGAGEPEYDDYDWDWEGG